MSVIRSLTSSRDSTDRDREKANLEKEFRECDSKLSSLVVSHHTDLSQVLALKINPIIQSLTQYLFLFRSSGDVCLLEDIGKTAPIARTCDCDQRKVADLYETSSLQKRRTKETMDRIGRE